MYFNSSGGHSVQAATLTSGTLAVTAFQFAHAALLVFALAFAVFVVYRLVRRTQIVGTRRLRIRRTAALDSRGATIRGHAQRGFATALGIVVALGLTASISDTPTLAAEFTAMRTAVAVRPDGAASRDGQGTVLAPTPGSLGVLALTFDDGPSKITPQLLDVLERKNVKATFFLQGSHVVQHPEIVRRIHAEGHVIGNHGWSHRTFDTLDHDEAMSEIGRTNDAIRSVTGETPVLFRYPQGVESDVGNTAIRALGMWGGVLWHWETGPGDYTCPGASGVQRYLNDNATDQAVLLLHDGNEVVDCPSNQLKYLAKAIDSLRERGFEFGVVATAGGPSWVNQYSWVRVIPAE